MRKRTGVLEGAHIELRDKGRLRNTAVRNGRVDLLASGASVIDAWIDRSVVTSVEGSEIEDSYLIECDLRGVRGTIKASYLDTCQLPERTDQLLSCRLNECIEIPG